MKRGKKPGSPKTGGRKPGSANKTSAAVKTFLNDFFEANKEQVIVDFQELQPKDRLAFFEKVIAYLMPKPTVSFDIQAEYKYLEQLLKETPEQYINELENRILTLNSQNNETE